MTAAELTPPAATGPADGLAAARLHRLREQLAAVPYDTLVLTSPESVCYATGYRSVAGQIFASHQMAAIVTGDDLWLVCPASDSAPAIEASQTGHANLTADRIIPYGKFYFAGDGPASRMSGRHGSFTEALTEAVAQAGRAGTKRCGVEGPAGPAAAALLPHSVDATEGMLAVRGVKLPAEQALLREAARLAEAGIEAALAAARTGITEQELAEVVSATMAAGGGVPKFVVVTAGPRSALGDAFATTRACQPGDLLRFDVGCVYQGYWSDIARTAVFGEPTAVQQSRYDALLAGLQAELDLAAPGVTAGEVFRAAHRTVEAGGLTPYRRHHAGHAIGLSVYEPPVVTPDTDTPLLPGMVFCLETPYYELGWGGMMVEDTGVVTETGFDLFTSIDRSLRVVPS